MSKARRALLDRLAAAIARLHPDRRIRIAIDGVDGAGKTTFADRLAPRVAAHARPVVRASVDDFHHPRAIRYARGRHSPESFYRDSYDYQAFRQLLLDPFGPAGSGRYVARHFDHRADQSIHCKPMQAPANAALIVDGIFLHRAELRGCWDLSIFLKVDFAVSTARNAARDGTPDAADANSLIYRRYVGGQQLYLSECSPESRADIVIGYNNPAASELLKWREP
jgi:uridine kinase